MMEIDSESLPKEESKPNENLSPIECLPQELAYHIIKFAEPNETKQLTNFDLANKRCNFGQILIEIKIHSGEHN